MVFKFLLGTQGTVPYVWEGVMSPLDNGVGSVKTMWVYSFGDGTADGSATLRNLLGGKGAN